MEHKFEVIDCLRVVLVILIIFLHAYTATMFVEWLHKGYPMYAFITYNFALLGGYIAVPFFFFISGFLFFSSSHGKVNYYKKWRRRIHTLLIPYIIWNAIILIMLYFLQSNSMLREYFSGNNKFIADYSWIDFFRAFWDSGHWDGGDCTPILSVLWYIRNLMIMSLLAPVIWYLNSLLKYFWLIPVFLVWLFTPRLAFTSCSIFWFGLGTYFSCVKVDLNLFFMRKRMIAIVSFMIFFLMYNVLFFIPLNVVLHVFIQRMCILFAIPVIYIIVLVGITRWKWKLLPLLSKATCFIFVFHYFLIIGIRKLVIKFFANVSDVGMVLLYFLSIILTLFVSFSVYVLLQKLMPRFLSIITGGRSRK